MMMRIFLTLIAVLLAVPAFAATQRMAVESKVPGLSFSIIPPIRWHAAAVPEDLNQPIGFHPADPEQMELTQPVPLANITLYAIALPKNAYGQQKKFTLNNFINNDVVNMANKIPKPHQIKVQALHNIRLPSGQEAQVIQMVETSPQLVTTYKAYIVDNNAVGTVLLSIAGEIKPIYNGYLQDFEQTVGTFMFKPTTGK
jgi:hypothetical protein